MSENKLKKILEKFKSIFVTTDLFREDVEDKLAKVLEEMSDFTQLDSVKEKLIQAGIVAGLAFVNSQGVSASLTTEQIATISESVIKYGHIAEDKAAIQFQKKGKTYQENASKK